MRTTLTRITYLADDLITSVPDIANLRDSMGTEEESSFLCSCHLITAESARKKLIDYNLLYYSPHPLPVEYLS